MCNELRVQITKWAMELVNYTSVTDRHKTNGLTAYQEQFANQDTLYSAYGINIAAWGTLCHCFQFKKNRLHKLSPKATRCIWNGVNDENTHSTSCIPISKKNGLWQLGKPIHSSQVILVRGVFPLKNQVDMDLPVPQGGASRAITSALMAGAIAQGARL